MEKQGRFRSLEDELIASKRDLLKILNAVRTDPEAMAKIRERVKRNQEAAERDG